jgi:hypothetical protein
MKYFLALSVFILGLSLGVKSTANEEHAAAPAHQDSEVCKPEENAKCDQKHTAGTHDSKKSKDWTHKRLEQVAAIMPQPVKNPEQADRPSPVKLVSPKFLSSVSGTAAKLQWTDSSRAKAYHIQVSKDAGFNNRSMYVADEKWVKDTTFDVSNLEPGQKYFWRVAAVNDENDSMFTKSLFVSSAFEVK